MADTTIQEQVVREAPGIEKAKLDLLATAADVASKPVDIPAMQVAGLAPQQIDAIKMAGLGVGSYEPYMKSAGEAYTKAAEGYGGLPQYGIAGMNAARNAGEDATSAVTDYGELATSLGIAGAGMYDPNSVTAFMNPYQQQVTQNSIAEMNRQAEIQRMTNASAAGKAGAFGGSRFGVQTAETNRNLAEVQAKKIFEDYANNYNQAQTASMNAFQNQQARAQTAGNLALGAGQNIGNTTIQAGQMGVNAATAAGNLQGASAAGLATLGTSTANLGQLQSGLQQGDTSFLYNIGEKQQQQRQKEMDAGRQTKLQAAYEPYQRVSFLSDIYKGAPSSQQTISQTTAPSASLVSQVAGMGTAGLAAYNLMGKP
jgi:hypothetical protein